MSVLVVEISGIDELRTTLNKVLKAVDVTEILDEAEALMLNRIRDRYLRQVSPDLVPWKPSQRVIHSGGSTLFLSGTLFHSIQAFAHGLDNRSIGTDVFYAPKHQYGQEHNEVREFLGFNDDDKDVVTRSILFRIMEALA